MLWPDVVEIDPAAADEYGNPATRTGSTVPGWLVAPGVLLLPPAAEVDERDRLLVNGRPYTVRAAEEKRSPSRRVLWRLEVTACPPRPT